MGISPEQLSALEAAVKADPRAPAFAALAELHRRAGRLAEAESVAREGLAHAPDAAEGRLVLACVLLEQGRSEDARTELEWLTGDVLTAHGIPSGGAAEPDLSDAELDDAFEQAETDTDELIDPNRVAEEAVVRVDARAGDGLREAGAADATGGDPHGAGGEDILSGSAFVTATMAELLERQGDARGARRIRDALEPAPAVASRAGSPVAAGGPAADSGRQRRIDTLERWLHNIRGDRR